MYLARRDRRSACNVPTLLDSDPCRSPHFLLFLVDADATPTRFDPVFSFRYTDSKFGGRETFIDLEITLHVEMHL